MNLNNLLSEFSGKSVYHMLNPGNRGDALLNQGSKYLFAAHGVHTTEIWHPDNVTGQYLFINGAGGFCKQHHDNVFRVLFYLHKFEFIFILPASFDTRCNEVSSFLKHTEVQKKVGFFCREKYSYEAVSKIYPSNRIFLDQDLAFCFNWSVIQKKKGRGRLNAFRTDPEGLGGRNIPKNNWDISIDSWLYPHHNWRFFYLIRNLNCRIKSKILGHVERQRCDRFIKDINRYEEIHTDRAHVAITVAMLGKRVYIYPNNYHKLLGLYERSLCNLKNVKFVNSELFDR